MSASKARQMREQHGISLQEATLVLERRRIERLLRENDLQTALEIIVRRMYPKDPG